MSTVAFSLLGLSFFLEFMSLPKCVAPWPSALKISKQTVFYPWLQPCGPEDDFLPVYLSVLPRAGTMAPLRRAAALAPL